MKYLSCRENLEMAVLVSVFALVAAGVFLGLRYKAPTLIAATALLVLGSVAWNGLGLPGPLTISSVLILVLVLQCAYLVGMALAVAWRRKAENGH